MIAEMRVERPEAELWHGKKRERKSKDDKKETETETENGALTESKQTAQRKRYHPPLDWFDGIE